MDPTTAVEKALHEAGAPWRRVALLHRNRSLRLVRFAHTRAGAVYVRGEVPAPAAPAHVDRLLGALVQAADDVRSGAQAARRRA